MIRLYTVRSSVTGTFLMTAPLSVVLDVFAPRYAGQLSTRIETETKNGGTCEVFFNHGPRPAFVGQAKSILVSRSSDAVCPRCGDPVPADRSCGCVDYSTTGGAL